MVILIVFVTATLSLGLGGYIGMRVTVRNVDRLLAVMTPDELTLLARKARARRQLLGVDQAVPASED